MTNSKPPIEADKMKLMVEEATKFYWKFIYRDPGPCPTLEKFLASFKTSYKELFE